MASDHEFDRAEDRAPRTRTAPADLAHRLGAPSVVIAPQPIRIPKRPR